MRNFVIQTHRIMAAIRNLNDLSPEQVGSELQRGARFVMYQYTISLILITFQRSSDIYFIPANESTVTKGLPFTFLSFALGWWGLPWGPIRTIQSLVSNFSGGKDVTQEVIGLMDTLSKSKTTVRWVA